MWRGSFVALGFLFAAWRRFRSALMARGFNRNPKCFRMLNPYETPSVQPSRNSIGCSARSKVEM
jgi:hypothetical protein